MIGPDEAGKSPDSPPTEQQRSKCSNHGEKRPSPLPPPGEERRDMVGSRPTDSVLSMTVARERETLV